MAFGIIAEPLPYVPMVGLSPSTTNTAAQAFILGLPPVRDMGYVTNDTGFITYLWNGTLSDATINAVSSTGDTDGITWDTVPPKVVLAKRSERLIVYVSVNGPIVFSAFIEILSSCNTLSLNVFGTRIPQVVGNIGYLMCDHDWSQGLSESFQWATDVMIAYDRTEQRVQLRNRARHALTIKLVESGRIRRHLETILSARMMRLYFFPMPMDIQQLQSPISIGDIIVNVNTDNTDYAVDRYLVVWDDYDNYELKLVNTMATTFITTGGSFSKNWPVGSYIAPGRFANILNTRKITRHTDGIAEFEILAELQGEIRKGGVSNPDVYLTYPVNDFPISWNDPQESLDNKWVKLDNITGVVTYDIQSLEPINSRSLMFQISGREPTHRFINFLYERDGKLSPFWVHGDGKAVEVINTALAGQKIMVVAQMDYERSLNGSLCRTHLEFELVSGDIFRVEIDSVLQTLDGNEELTFTENLPFDVSESVLLRVNWLELVRFDTDDIKIKWETDTELTADIQIVTLP